MIDLTPRQIQILKCLIKEHIASGEPVGSITLENKYNLGVSPATIRNEMNLLTKKGWLEQPHTSAGRAPTADALKFYIKNLMEKEALSVSEEVSVKEKVWDYRDDLDRLVQEAVRALADVSENLAVGLNTAKHNVYHAGHSYILNDPTFYDIDVTKQILSVIDDFEQLHRWIKQYNQHPVNVLLSDDFGLNLMQPCGMVYTQVELPNDGLAAIGALGPRRLDFDHLIPTVEYFGRLMQEIVRKQ